MCVLIGMRMGIRATGLCCCCYCKALPGDVVVVAVAEITFFKRVRRSGGGEKMSRCESFFDDQQAGGAIDRIVRGGVRKGSGREVAFAKSFAWLMFALSATFHPLS